MFYVNTKSLALIIPNCSNGYYSKLIDRVNAISLNPSPLNTGKGKCCTFDDLADFLGLNYSQRKAASEAIFSGNRELIYGGTF